MMVYNLVRVARVGEGGGGRIIYIEFAGSTLPVYDERNLAPDYAAGELHEVKLRLQALEVEEGSQGVLGASGDRFYGRVVHRIPLGSGWSYVLELGGLRAHLDTAELHPVGGYLSVVGRLVLEDIMLPEREGLPGQ